MFDDDRLRFVKSEIPSEFRAAADALDERTRRALKSAPSSFEIRRFFGPDANANLCDLSDALLIQMAQVLAMVDTSSDMEWDVEEARRAVRAELKRRSLPY